MTAAVTITARKGDKVAKVDGMRVHFSAHQCFAYDDGPDDRACIERLADHLLAKPGLAVFGAGRMLTYILKHAPILASNISGVIPFKGEIGGSATTFRVLDAAALPADIETVFLCETTTLPRTQMRKQLPSRVEIVEPGVLADIARDVAPLRAWTPVERNIYPIDVPEIVLPAGKDLLVMDCPARNLALMPNGLAYVNNALKKSSVSFAVFDLDIITYHRFHMRRLFDDGGRVVLSNGRVLPVDPWQAEHYDLWSMQEVIDYFMPIIEEAAEQVVKARPKILGLSVQQCSEAYSRRLVNLVRERLPDIVVVVGGFSCYNADIGLKSFPEADYMCIGEADLTVGPLMEMLAKGKRPANVAGVVSRYDDPKVPFIPAPMPHNLSALEPPKYEWFDLNVYRNFNGYQLTPIIASRGCRWSRCTFCAERFYWRIRDPKEFADEVEWLSSQGCTLFMFNESDLNGMPEKVLEICDEIIKRNLNVKLTGQLRIHKKSDRAFFQKLRQAGFVALRFGVDAFSANTLRLQKKGYTPEMVSQNLKDCWEAGIFTEVNWVIGVPGETDADVDEGIELILKNRDYIGRLANINPLILVNGGVYWLDPDSHNIVFREPKDQIYAKNPKVIPADLWYSTEPYIDAQVRKERFEKIVLALHDAGFPVGEWAARVIEDVKYARDRNRAGGAKSSAAKPALAAPAEAKRDAKAESKPEAKAKTIGSHQNVVGAEQPRLVRDAGPHNVVFYKGLYYAIPKALGPVDLTAEDVEGRPGVVIDSDESQVLAELKRLASGDGGAAAQPPAAGRGEPKAERPKSKPTASAAQPGVVGAEQPRLMRDAGTHNIVFYKGIYYALPKALGHIDLTTEEDIADLSGVVSDSDENAVLAELALVAKWADSRGHFDAQEEQKAKGSYLKANSQHLEPEKAEMSARPVLLRFEGQDYAIEKATIDAAFATEPGVHPQAAAASTDLTDDEKLALQSGRKSAWHSAFNMMPPAIRAEIRRAIISQNSVKGPSADGSLPSGMSLATSAVRGLMQRVRSHGLGVLVGKPAILHKGETTTTAGAEGVAYTVYNAISKDATPELMRTIANYNLVQYDGRFYGVPHGNYIDWNDFDIEAVPGMVAARTAKEATWLIEAAIGKTSQLGTQRSTDVVTGPASEAWPLPVLLETVGEYNLVGYEGWIYGIPHTLGALDLTETDVTELPGVIKDVSRDVVINEINDLSGRKSAVAAE